LCCETLEVLTEKCPHYLEYLETTSSTKPGSIQEYRAVEAALGESHRKIHDNERIDLPTAEIVMDDDSRGGNTTTRSNDRRPPTGKDKGLKRKMKDAVGGRSGW